MDAGFFFGEWSGSEKCKRIMRKGFLPRGNPPAGGDDLGGQGPWWQRAGCEEGTWLEPGPRAAVNSSTQVLFSPPNTIAPLAKLRLC